MSKLKRIFGKKSALSSAILTAIGTAHGGTILVDGPCSLVDAIQAANNDLPVGSCNAGSGDDVIQVITPDSNIQISTIFEPSADGPGSAGLPVINSTITIEGNGMTVSADNSVENFRLFDVASAANLTLRDTTVSNANDGYGLGSGLFTDGGRVTIENSTFALNNGAILLANSLGSVIDNTVIRHNRNSELYAAGLQTFFSEVSLDRTSFVDNKHFTADYVRGALPPIAAGAGLVQSEVTITNSTFSGNDALYGAGLLIKEDAPPPVPAKSARFGNSDLRGVITSDTRIVNSTITNNRGLLGAGIFDAGDYSTITLQGNILAGNISKANGYAPNLFSIGNSTIVTDANNIVGEKGEQGTYNLTLGASDLTFSNAAKDNLYPLTLANGQLMHPLKLGSIAIDGNDFSCFGSLLDQEGKGRGKDGDDNGSFLCDVGSFEHTLPIIADNAPCEFVNAMLSAENDSSVGGCQPGNGHDIVVIPESTTISLNTIADVIAGYSPYFTFGLPRIETAVTIEANGSAIERDAASTDSFDLFYVADGGQLNLIDADVTGANGGLGAVTAWYGGNMNVVDSNISGNQSMGIFDIQSINSSVTNTTVSQNAPTLYGVGLNYSALSTLNSVGFELRQSTISGNTSQTGGGVDFRNVTQASMDNSTVSGNTGTYIGGLILAPLNNQQSGADVRNSTITGNSGLYAGGIYAVSTLPVNTFLSHSVVSGNVSTPPPPRQHARAQLGSGFSLAQGFARVRGSYANEINSNNGYLGLDASNIIGQNGDASSMGITIGSSDMVPAGPTDTVIGTTLADNGGATLTHLPVTGGLAVDTGDSFCGLNEDQLGRVRPWDGDEDGNENCDIGAVELGSVIAGDIIFKDGFDTDIVIRRAKLKH